MGRDNHWLGLLGQVSFYRRSAGMYAVLALIILGGWQLFGRGSLKADEFRDLQTASNDGGYDFVLDLTPDGQLYLDNRRLDSQIVNGDQYRLRWQLLENNPRDFIESLTVVVRLPSPVTEGQVGHRLISNGGALEVSSQLLDSQTILYRASQIGREAQLVIELEVPKSIIRVSMLARIQQLAYRWGPNVWLGISAGVLGLAGAILLLLAFSRRRLPLGISQSANPPSRLKPALIGVLLNGRLSSRDLAATLVDLARRGHLVIRELSPSDWRFSRAESTDQLEEFERELLGQIFPPTSSRIGGEEISLRLASQLFNEQISRAFILAYKQIGQYGFFAANPLVVHRRYQITGMLFFLVGLIGFLGNLIIFSDFRHSLLMWLAVIVAGLWTAQLAKKLPARTVEGDRELANWLSFGRYLAEEEPINFRAQSQELYLTYLPYAIVMNIEVEWTKRFYELPFSQPQWYLAARVSTIDEFANRIFPLFAHLAQLLANSTQPASR